MISSKNMIQISIVLPLYNKEKSVFSSIKSILDQTYTSFELIIVNDGSTDNSYEVAKKFCDPRIRFFSKMNGGVSSARNYGIQRSKYDHIAFLDADDFWDSNYLKEMSIVISKYPKALMYFCPHENIDENRKHMSSAIKTWEIKRSGIISIFEYSIEEGPCTIATIIKKTVNGIIQNFDETLVKGEDIDLWINIALKGEVVYYNNILSFCNLNGENRAMKRKSDKSKSLIWNLDRFIEFEEANCDLKIYLDKMRISHIENYLGGNSIEVDEIESLLNKIDFSKYGFFWKIIKVSPKIVQIYLFRVVFFIKKVYTFLGRKYGKLMFS